jgi:hypothetical protein
VPRTFGDAPKQKQQHQQQTKPPTLGEGKRYAVSAREWKREIWVERERERW